MWSCFCTPCPSWQALNGKNKNTQLANVNECFNNHHLHKKEAGRGREDEAKKIASVLHIMSLYHSDLKKHNQLGVEFSIIRGNGSQDMLAC